VPTTNPTHPPMVSRTKGQAFEDRCLNHLLHVRNYQRPTGRLSALAQQVRAALQPTGKPGVFEHATVAEGLWLTVAGDPIWVECSGAWGTTYRPGLRRSDTVRKIAGTIACVRSVCLANAAPVPAVLLMTSHEPAAKSAAAAYLRWGVIAPVGADRVEIVRVASDGTWMAVPVATYWQAKTSA
jgi:hypothetical protein